MNEPDFWVSQHLVAAHSNADPSGLEDGEWEKLLEFCKEHGDFTTIPANDDGDLVMDDFRRCDITRLYSTCYGVAIIPS